MSTHARPDAEIWSGVGLLPARSSNEARTTLFGPQLHWGAPNRHEQPNATCSIPLPVQIGERSVPLHTEFRQLCAEARRAKPSPRSSGRPAPGTTGPGPSAGHPPLQVSEAFMGRMLRSCAGKREQHTAKAKGHYTEGLFPHPFLHCWGCLPDVRGPGCFRGGSGF